LIHEIRTYSGEDGFKQAQNYWLDWSDGPQGPVGVELVLPQGFGFGECPIWHINQDLILSLGLLQEGDVWVRPEEGFLDVIRLTRGSDGHPRKIEIRAELLKDYLAASKMALRMAWYRDRDTIIADSSGIPWGDDGIQESSNSYRFEARNYAVHIGSGSPLGSQSAVFHVWRTDVDNGVEVPEFGPESDKNTGHTSKTFDDSGAKAFRVEGEIWAEEWVEPTANSLRIRRDHVPSNVAFIIDAAGQTENADALDNEDIGKYLWFRCGVINDLLARRGATWNWHSRDTCRIQLNVGEHVHFGLNSLNLINAYAYDIAKLPEWQRRIWQGFNVSPDGGVCAELLMAQMQAQPVHTLAPEAHIGDAIRDIDAAFNNRFSKNLFKYHPSNDEISKSLHRFRAVAQGGIFSLAKDVTRAIIEALDVHSLHEIAPARKGEGSGSLKSLERVLATIVSPDEARSALSPLVGIYELRGADAHLPSSQLDDAFRLAGVDASTDSIAQGHQILMALMRSCVAIVTTLEDQS
jgi:hypothetical protein